MREEQQLQEEQPKENQDEMKFFEEINLSDFKSSKIEKEALKDKFFELRLRKLSDEDLDKILEEIELMKDGAVSVFSRIIFLKKMIDAGTKENFKESLKEKVWVFSVLEILMIIIEKKDHIQLKKKIVMPI